MAETKPKQSPSLREPKPKKRLGLSVPPALRLPHDDLIPHRIEETRAEETSTMPSLTSQTRHSTNQANQITPPAAPEKPVAPVRDYTKVANSINREAVPAGIFNGKSKQLYDCLYSLTRGAVVPSRTVRISRPKLMKKAGIGARVTFEANLERLSAVGLVQVRSIAGEHDGNEYRVFLPEEISMPSQTSQTSLTRHAQKLDRLVSLETSQTRHTLNVENTGTSDEPKTSFKTNTEKNDDDEAFAGLVAALRQTAVEITGKKPSPTEAERWRELADVLTTELKIAAGRTSVSSVPSFFAEHLRRRLFKKDRAQLASEEKSAPTPPVKVDASKCPDCFGTGMWYPEGYEKGVAKCSHESLLKTEG